MSNKDKKKINNLFNYGIVLVLLILVTTVVPKINNKEGLLNDISGSTNLIAAAETTTVTVWSLNCSCDCSLNTDSIAARNCMIEVGDGWSGIYSDYNAAMIDASSYASDCALRTPMGSSAICEPVPIQQEVSSDILDNAKIKIVLTPTPKKSKSGLTASSFTSIDQYYYSGDKININLKVYDNSGNDITDKVDLSRNLNWTYSCSNKPTISTDKKTIEGCILGGLGTQSIAANVTAEGRNLQTVITFNVVRELTSMPKKVEYVTNLTVCDWVLTSGTGSQAPGEVNSYTRVCSTKDIYNDGKGYSIGRVAYAELPEWTPLDYTSGFLNGSGFYWYTSNTDIIQLLYKDDCALINESIQTNGRVCPEVKTYSQDSRIYFKTLKEGTATICVTSDVVGNNLTQCGTFKVYGGLTLPTDTPVDPSNPIDPSSPEVNVQLKTLNITSSNADKTIAKLNDTITLNITTNASTTKPTVTIGGVNATVTGTGTKFTAKVKVTSAMPDGKAAYTVTLNNGLKYSMTTDGSYVNIYKTGFGMSSVTIQSSNYKHNVAYEGQTVTVKMVATEDLKKAPNVSIGGIVAKVYGSGKEYTAYITTTSAMKAGILTIKISGYTNAGGTVGNTITATTDSSSVIFIKTSTNPGGSSGGTTKKVNVSSAALNKSIIYLKPNEEEQLTVVILPVNATNKTVNWKSLDSKIATVDTTGLVKAKANGKTEISITTADGGFISKTYVVVSSEEHAYSADSSLINLKIDGYTLDFKPADHSYTITAKSNVSSLDITPVLSDSKATYKIIGNSNLTSGSTVKIVVTAEDYSTTTYTIKVNKKAKTNVGLIVGIVAGVILLGGAGYYFYTKKKQNTSF